MRGEVWNFTDAGVQPCCAGAGFFWGGLCYGWIVKMKQTISKITYMNNHQRPACQAEKVKRRGYERNKVGKAETEPCENRSDGSIPALRGAEWIVKKGAFLCVSRIPMERKNAVHAGYILVRIQY